LVEMTETALILREATDKSLVIMDEVGRGTSTEDGLSIAWAVSEYLLDTVKCKTLFATHYHELTRIAHPALILLCLKVLEQDGNVVFLKQIFEGASANSYGIHVARLAGIPESVIARSRDLLARFQTAAGELPDATGDTEVLCAAGMPHQTNPAVSATDETVSAGTRPGLFSDEELIIDEILSLKPDTITPLEALQLVSRWKKGLGGV
jgi:DNA mismatch repair protein MutS